MTNYCKNYHLSLISSAIYIFQFSAATCCSLICL